MTNFQIIIGIVSCLTVLIFVLSLLGFDIWSFFRD